MKWWLIPLAVLCFAAFTLRIASERHDGSHGPVGGAWWVVLGVAVGLLLGFIAFVAATRPWRWRVQVEADGYGKVDVKVTRLFGEVRVGTLNPADDQFDDRLHQMVAEARSKAVALETAR